MRGEMRILDVDRVQGELKVSMPIGEWRKIREAISDAKSKKWSEALEDFGVAIDTLIRRIEEVVDNKLDIF